MYYTHEYSNEIFEDYDDCREALLMEADIYEYVNRISYDQVLWKFFARKSNEAFCSWLEHKIFEAEEAIAEELIFEHEDEDENDE